MSDRTVGVTQKSVQVLSVRWKTISFFIVYLQFAWIPRNRAAVALRFAHLKLQLYIRAFVLS